MGKEVGPWEDLKKLLAKYDTQKLSKPLTAVAEPHPEGHWDCGPFRQFGITNVLVEGGSDADMQQNLDAGEALMPAIVEYYRDCGRGRSGRRQDDRPLQSRKRCKRITLDFAVGQGPLQFLDALLADVGVTKVQRLQVGERPRGVPCRHW